jgi:glycosyl transferase family 25
VIKTFIIHVSKGYEERRKHIDSHLPSRGINEYEYMLRGDIDDLSDAIRHEFFGSKLSLAEKSCFYKHYLVMKEAVERNIEQVLVLEDDALLVSSFTQDFSLILSELEGQSNYFANIEEASNSVPLSVRKSNQYLYPCKVNKLCGGYVFDLIFAKKMVEYIESQQIDTPIDGLIGDKIDELQFNLYWVHPPVVKQGSKVGMFESQLSGRTSGLYATARSWFKEGYRTHIRSHLSKKQKALFENVTKY